MISVIIPTHQPKYLKDVLIALKYQKTTISYEVVVVENPEETEPVKQLVNNFGFIYAISELGANKARDIGVRLSKYPIIALLDDDSIPNPNFVEQIYALNATHSDYSVFGGPLFLEYRAEKPKWVVGIFEKMLSSVFLEANSPRKLLENEYLVSANMFFKKTTYKAVGGLSLDMGYVGRNWQPNDEIEFIQKCKEIGPVYYSPTLSCAHQIDETRLNLGFFRKRFYGQGVADAKLYLRKNWRKSANDCYHDWVQPTMSIIDLHANYAARELICNEDITRDFIKYLIICKTDYCLGVQNVLNGTELWSMNLR